jgi:autotransporter-associated beta strand protein
MPCMFTRSPSRWVLAVVVAAAALGISSPAAAQTTSNWGGGASPPASPFTWSTAANWDNPVANGNNLVFASAAAPANTLATSNDIAGLSINKITVNATATGPVSVGGTGFTLGSGGITMTGSATASQFTIGFDAGQSLALGAGQTWTTTGARTLRVDSPIVDGPGGPAALIMTASGTAPIYVINGANTYSGGATISGNTTNMQIGSSTVLNGSTITSGPFGTGPVTWLINTNSPRPSAINGPQTVANPMTIAAGLVLVGTNNLTFSGPISLTNATVTLNMQMTQATGVTDPTALTLNGDITLSTLAAAKLTLEYQNTGPGAAITIINGVIKESPGVPGSVTMASTAISGTPFPGATVRVMGANTYTGGTTIQSNASSIQIGISSNALPGPSFTSGPFGTGTVTITNSTSTPQLQAFGGDRNISNALLLSSGLFATGSNNLTFDGVITMNVGNRTFTNNLAAGKVETLTNTIFTSEVGGAAQRTPTFTGTGTTFITGAITPQTGVTGTAGLSKTGTGIVNLMNNSTYAGTTTITGGLLLANNPNSGSATGSGPITVTGTGAAGSGGTLGGGNAAGTAGFIAGNVTISVSPVGVTSGGILSPGNSAGTLTVNSSSVMTWNPLGTYVFEHDVQATGTPTPGGLSDLVSGTGSATLSLVNLTAASPFNLVLAPVNEISGPLPTSAVTYTIADFSGSTAGSSAIILPSGFTGTDLTTLFNPNATGSTYQSGLGFTAALVGGNMITVTFTPVPEPGFVLAVCGGVTGLAAFRRRARDRSRS